LLTDDCLYLRPACRTDERRVHLADETVDAVELGEFVSLCLECLLALDAVGDVLDRRDGARRRGSR
jgi:hypothetical protein